MVAARAGPLLVRIFHINPPRQTFAPETWTNIGSLACLVSGLVGTAFFTTIPARKLVLNCILIYSSTEVVSDIIVTGSIYYGLSRSKTGWTNTDQVITRLMKIMVETQTPPSIL